MTSERYRKVKYIVGSLMFGGAIGAVVTYWVIALAGIRYIPSSQLLWTTVVCAVWAVIGYYIYRCNRKLQPKGE